MSENEKSKRLRDIHAAIKIFPKIVAQKERAYREKQKVLKNFEAFSSEFAKLTAQTSWGKPKPMKTNDRRRSKGQK